MGKIIAATYEILSELGSGGGGVVYLARHLRLEKLVAVKVDRRGLAAGTDALRQEVDALKNLSHTYIPQVYDYIEEDGAVYTVIDYIEGESLDKALKRGERFPQAQVISWAWELLEALEYLHSRPPNGILHGDIKPANIMRTPQGDIRLIDFNIALALGMEGAVQVGYSQGYASPEHYTASLRPVLPSSVPTVLLDSHGNELPGQPQRTRTLDVRSDIYSLGATLYHLLTGKRPARDARDVEPIQEEGVSPMVAAIIKKAMAPEPGQRYQTSEEMQQAFQRLHEDDPRKKRHRRMAQMAAALCTTVFLLGGACSFAGLQIQAHVHARLEQQATQARDALALVQQAEEASAGGDVPGSIRLALQALALSPPSAPRVQKVLSDSLGIYQLAEGFQASRMLPVASEPLKLALSPDGSRAAVVSLGEVEVFEVASGRKLASLEAEPSALADAVFAGEDILLYAGKGGIRAYSLEKKEEIWAGGPVTSLALSADGQTVAGLYKDSGFAQVYRCGDGTALAQVDFSGKKQWVAANDIFIDPQEDIFALSPDGAALAVSFEDGSLWVFSTADPGEGQQILAPSPYTAFEGGFCGRQLVFTASFQEEAFVSAVDLSQWIEGDSLPVLLAQNKPFRLEINSEGCLVQANGLFFWLNPETGETSNMFSPQTELITLSWGGEYLAGASAEGDALFLDKDGRLLDQKQSSLKPDMIQARGGNILLGSYSAPYIQVFRKAEYNSAPAFSYDPEYIHSEARVDPGSGTLLIFQHDRFQIYDGQGRVAASKVLPDADQVYDQQYRRDSAGNYLEVTYNNGKVACYSANTGELLEERQEGPTRRDGYEEFETSLWRITSPVHGAPEVYDKQTGERLGELETEDYLTYVTQMESGGVVTEYITSSGERYGLLLDEERNVVARMPGLCDLLPDGRLWFDDQMGAIREGHIYSLEELVALADTTLNKEELS